MRYDTPIFFQTVAEKGKYDSSTGNYEPDKPTEEQCWASVTDSRTETVKMLYGEPKQGCLTIRLQNIYIKPFDKIRIGDKLYREDFSRKLRTKHIFVVSEVQ